MLGVKRTMPLVISEEVDSERWGVSNDQRTKAQIDEGIAECLIMLEKARI